MSTPKFHTLSVSNIKSETNDCVSVALHIPEDLAKDYLYVAGQYITFKKNVNGQEEIRRSYSICSAPHEKELRVAIKTVEDGVFSNYANKLMRVGENLEVMTPTGHFTYSKNNASQKNYIAFVSGSGITPVMSIIKDILYTQSKSTFTLVYGNKNLASIIFKEELESLKNIYTNRLQIIHILSRERLEVDLNYGRIDTAKCEKLFEKLLDISTFNEAFLCGPEEMILNVKAFLNNKGMPTENIHLELFGTSASYEKQKNKTAATIEPKGPVSKVSVKVDDRTMIIDLPASGLNILDAALQGGADLPYACKGGVCCTCRAKVISGTVKMDVNYALEDAEVAAGFILTCQAHPTSAEVFIDFDVS
jgi:ring-1,2-phenylacetyl-CoA epoxidase subunit PaaE